jgi:hypothetical protein
MYLIVSGYRESDWRIPNVLDSVCLQGVRLETTKCTRECLPTGSQTGDYQMYSIVSVYRKSDWRLPNIIDSVCLQGVRLETTKYTR